MTRRTRLALLSGAGLLLAALVGAIAPATAVAESKQAAAPATRNFELRGLDGGRHRLTEWRGKVVLLNFWASWCPPCLSEIPDLVALQARYRAQGLVVVGLGIDEASKLRNVARTLDINYPVLVVPPDGGEEAMRPWGNKIGIVPFTVLIDREGQVQATHRGPITADELEEMVRPLVGGAGQAS